MKLLRALILIAIFGLSAFPQPPISAQGYDDMVNAARVLLKEQKYTEAATKGREAIALDKSRWEGYYVTATAYVGVNQCDAAVQYFQTALDHGPPEPVINAINAAASACEQLLTRGALSSKADPSPPSNPSLPANTRINSIYNGHATVPGVTLPGLLSYKKRARQGRISIVQATLDNCRLEIKYEYFAADGGIHQENDGRMSLSIPLADVASQNVKGFLLDSYTKRFFDNPFVFIPPVKGKPFTSRSEKWRNGAWVAAGKEEKIGNWQTEGNPDFDITQTANALRSVAMGCRNQ